MATKTSNKTNKNAKTNNTAEIYTPYTVKKLTDMVWEGKYLLPSIQRKYVWKEKDIICLFDSLMLGYPIGSFLVWQSNNKTILSNKYYMCLHHIDFNKAFTEHEVEAAGRKNNRMLLLDGQQRLTSLCVGLNGSITKNNHTSESYLYFNHTVNPKLNTTTFNKSSYEFKFLTTDENKKYNWFKVNDIIDPKSIKTINKNKTYTPTEVNNLKRLYDIIHKNKNLFVYELPKDSSAYDVLSVFSRLNKQGQSLSTVNLIFSVICAHWGNARDEIDNLLTNINGCNFKFFEDYIIKVALACIDLPISLNLEKFTKDDVDKIVNNWDLIKRSIQLTIDLLQKEYYMNKHHILSENALVPVNYYIYKKLVDKQKNNTKGDYLSYGYSRILNNDDILNIKKFLVAVQTNKIFENAPNKVAESLCKHIDKKYSINKSRFKLEMFDDWDDKGKKIVVNKELVESYFSFKKGSPKAFLVLSLLYPKVMINPTNKHQDHAHPKILFSDKNLKTIIPDQTSDEWKFYKKEYDLLANIHFMEGDENQSKNDTPLDQWLESDKVRINEIACLPFVNDVLVNKDFSCYNIKNFKNFIDERKKLIREKLYKELNVK